MSDEESKPQQADKAEPIESEGPISTRRQLEQVEEREAIGANVIYETIRREGRDELARPWQALAWSGLAAGLSMGFSLVAEGLLVAHLPDSPWRILISRLGYCLGFLIVVLGRQQLFTETTLTAVLPLLVKRDKQTLIKVLRLWGTVLAANLLGTFGFALLIGRSVIFDAQVRAAFQTIGLGHTGVPLGANILRAIFAGWLIALMVWLLPGAHTGRVPIIVILTYVIGLGSFTHVVAGSTSYLYLVVTGVAPWSHYVREFLFPALVGNIMGGVALVAALGHAQVAGGSETR
ncbi:MAG TPA: formate/nitrite transporter family protein [Terriglobales bacterium]|jgi:formate/nitrite transporter FocA (FNT family)